MRDHDARDMRDIPTANEIKAGRLWNRCIGLLAEPPKYTEDDSPHPVQLIHRALDEQGTWIDRRKRLPKEGARVLVHVNRSQILDNDGKMARVFIATKEGPFWDGPWSIPNPSVTHWMPLPEEP